MSVVDPGNTGRSHKATLSQAFVRWWKRVSLKQIAFWIGPSLLSVGLFFALVLFGPSVTERLVKTDPHESKSLELNTLIREVKAELQQADREAVENNEAAMFKLKEFDLDLNFVATGKTAQVLTIGSNVEVGRERVQHIHLVWTPAGSVPVAAEPREITENPTATTKMESVPKGGPTQ